MLVFFACVALDVNSELYISLDISSHLPSVIITTLIINHPVILPFQTRNFPISQILPSIDIWHLFGLISRILGLHYGFFSVSVFFSSFSVTVISFRLSFSVLGLLSVSKPSVSWFLFFAFLVPFETFLVSFSSCARLKWQLACRFFSANNISYHIVSEVGRNRAEFWTVSALWNFRGGPRRSFTHVIPPAPLLTWKSFLK